MTTIILSLGGGCGSENNDGQLSSCGASSVDGPDCTNDDDCNGLFVSGEKCDPDGCCYTP